jgi:hypothetical protein
MMKRIFCAALAGFLAMPLLAAPRPAPLPRDSVYQLAAPLTDQNGRK